MAASVDFSGTWKLESSSPNFEEMLTALNIGIVMRKVIVNLSPEVTIKQDGDEFHIVTKTPIKTQESNFTVGKEFQQKHIINDTMRTILVTWEGASLVSKVLNDDNSPVTTRSMDEDGKMRVTQKKGELEVFRLYTKA